jgi:hypothetical protein
MELQSQWLLKCIKENQISNVIFGRLVLLCFILSQVVFHFRLQINKTLEKEILTALNLNLLVWLG